VCVCVCVSCVPACARPYDAIIGVVSGQRGGGLQGGCAREWQFVNTIGARKRRRRRRKRRRRKVYSGANAVNEEDPERKE